MDYRYLFFIRKSGNYTVQEREFLSKLLFSSTYLDNFSLNRALIDISFATSVKRSFDNDDKSKCQLLIYYSSPIKLARICNNIIQILSSTEDKYNYDLLTKSDKFIVIGNNRVGKLKTQQSKYINKVMSSTSFLRESPKLCKHYKDFNGEKFKS